MDVFDSRQGAFEVLQDDLLRSIEPTQHEPPLPRMAQFGPPHCPHERRQQADPFRSPLLQRGSLATEGVGAKQKRTESMSATRRET